MPNLVTTTISLPPIRLSSRCAICGIWETKPALFDEINEKLLGGVGQTKIVAWLRAKHKFRTNQNSLSRHLNRHLMPYFEDALLIERTALAIAQATGSQSTMSLAGVILRILASKIHDALGGLDLKRIKNLDPLDLMKAATALASTIAYADRAASDSALKAEELELRKLRLAKSKEELAALAVDWLRKQLAGRPDLVEHLRAQLALPEPEMEHRLKPVPPGEAERRLKPAAPGREAGGLKPAAPGNAGHRVKPVAPRDTDES